MARRRVICGGLAWALVFASAAPALAQEAPAAPLTVLYTGFTQGLSSGSVDFSELTPILTPVVEGGVPVATGFTPDNAFRQGGVVVYAASGPLTLEDLEAFERAGGLRVERLAPARALVSDYAYVLESRPPAPGRAEWLVETLAEALAAAGKYPDVRARSLPRFALYNAARVRLEGFALTPDAELDPARFAGLAGWEMLPAGALAAWREGQRTPAIAIGRPLGEGLRRAALLQRLKAETDEPLVLDAGNLVEPGVSDWSTTARAFTLEKLGALGYDAIVPAENELALPEADRARLAAVAPLVATNLIPKDPAAPWPFRRVFETRRAGRSVAVVGVVDDRALDRAGLTTEQAPWKVADPVETAKQVVAELLQRPRPPEAILLLSNVRDARLHELRHILGVTAVVGDFVGLPGDTYSETVSLSGVARARALTAPLVAHSSKNRLGRLTIRYGPPPAPEAPPPLLSLSNEARLVADWLPPVPEWRRRFDRLKDGFQRARQAILLPDPRELPDPRPGWTQGLWSRLVAEATREAAGAEVAILKAPALAPGALGPMNRLMVEASLETRERLVSLAVPGRALPALAALGADGPELAFAGYDPAAKTVAGAALVDDEYYRVVTTEGLWRHPRFAAAFEAKHPRERFRMAPDGALSEDPAAGPALLKDVALAKVVALGRPGGPFSPPAMAALERWLAGPAPGPRWAFKLEDGQLDANGTNVSGAGAYGQVRNTRVTAPNAFALGGKGKLAATYDAPDFALEQRIRAIYRRQSIEKAGVYVGQETDDELAFTSEYRLKRWAPVSFGLTPYLNGSYVTEFVPDLAEGVPKPRRSELNAVGGLLLPLGYGFKELRLGAIVRNDLANPQVLEPGFTSQLTFERTLEPWLPATFKSGLDVTQYLPTPLDQADRLGLLATWTTSLSVPIWERLTLTFATDYFAFRGKVPATSQLGSNFVARVALGYQLTFKPLAGIWF